MTLIIFLFIVFKFFPSLPAWKEEIIYMYKMTRLAFLKRYYNNLTKPKKEKKGNIASRFMGHKILQYSFEQQNIL